MNYSVSYQYQLQADSPIDAQSKIASGEAKPNNVTVREIPDRPARPTPAPAPTPAVPPTPA